MVSDFGSSLPPAGSGGRAPAAGLPVPAAAGLPLATAAGLFAEAAVGELPETVSTAAGPLAVAGLFFALLLLLLQARLRPATAASAIAANGRRGEVIRGRRSCMSRVPPCTSGAGQRAALAGSAA